MPPAPLPQTARERGDARGGLRRAWRVPREATTRGPTFRPRQNQLPFIPSPTRGRGGALSDVAGGGPADADRRRSRAAIRRPQSAKADFVIFQPRFQPPRGSRPPKHTALSPTQNPSPGVWGRGRQPSRGTSERSGGG